MKKARETEGPLRLGNFQGETEKIEKKGRGREKKEEKRERERDLCARRGGGGVSKKDP